jgi:hypothetical protein
VVSVGDENDKGLIVWETVSPRMISANLMQHSRVLGVEYLKAGVQGVLFVTYGTAGHLKVWRVGVEKDHIITVYSIPEGRAKQDPGSKVPKLLGDKLTIPGCDDNFNYSQVVIDGRSTSGESEIAYIIGYTSSKTGADHKAYSLFKFNLITKQVLA